MMYRTAYRNAKGEAVPSPKPELSEEYKDLVLKPLQDAQASHAAVSYVGTAVCTSIHKIHLILTTCTGVSALFGSCDGTLCVSI